ncbi:acylphosphatase [candidate division WOR-3 bacterium]|nr:acylphosphatase [candidate division WOR-3 bacterium]
MIRAYIHISGLVQGVYYRWFAQNNARSLGLTGYVKNLFDRGVEVVVEGERSLIEEYIKQLKVGPIEADVKDLKIEWQECTGEFSEFGVKY